MAAWPLVPMSDGLTHKTTDGPCRVCGAVHAAASKNAPSDICYDCEFAYRRSVGTLEFDIVQFNAWLSRNLVNKVKHVRRHGFWCRCEAVTKSGFQCGLDACHKVNGRNVCGNHVHVAKDETGQFVGDTYAPQTSFPLVDAIISLATDNPEFSDALTRAMTHCFNGKLTDAYINEIQLPKSNSKRVSDGGKLYLNVTANGAKSWVLLWKDVTGPKAHREMGLGRYPDVTIAMARTRAAQARAILAEGGDPILDRQIIKPERQKAS